MLSSYGHPDSLSTFRGLWREALRLLSTYCDTVIQVSKFPGSLLFPATKIVMSFYKSLVVGLLALSTTIHAYSNPEPCTGSCWAHDPALIQRESDGLYFRFNTDTYIDIKTSTSLSGPWTDAGSVLPSGSMVTLTGSTGLWVSGPQTLRPLSALSLGIGIHSQQLVLGMRA